MQELFDTVRAEASRESWSRGVELARSGAVTREGPPTHSGAHAPEGHEGAELLLRVRPSTGLIHPTVLLHLEDAEWECDCPSREDPCEHVAAAVIALRRAEREKRRLPTAGDSAALGRVVYRLARNGDGLSLERHVIAGGHETRLSSTLTALASGRVGGPL